MPKKVKSKKVYNIYDTSYILQNHRAVESHSNDMNVVPYIVLEELDTFKKGEDEINMEARAFIRWLDKSIIPNGGATDVWHTLKKGTPGRIMIAHHDSSYAKFTDIDLNVNDNKILQTALKIQSTYPNSVVNIMTFDIILRLKAKLHNLGTNQLEKTVVVGSDFKIGRPVEKKEGISDDVVQSLYSNNFVKCEDVTPKRIPQPNTFFILTKGNAELEVIYNKLRNGYTLIPDNLSASGIKPRSRAQRMAMHVLLDPSIRLVVIHGTSGVGKTILPLASAIESKKNYEQIFLSRPIVALNNKDIGYLPGDAKTKLDPYMQPLWDNFDLIKRQYPTTSKEYEKLTKMVTEEKLLIQPLAYIRGRSLTRIYFIIDEAQNLTPLEVKTIITRAGADTKIILAGDINQIDTPYLGEENNGLSYVTREIQSRPNSFSAIITLDQGERSELATWGSLMK